MEGGCESLSALQGQVTRPHDRTATRRAHLDPGRRCRGKGQEDLRDGARCALEGSLEPSGQRWQVNLQVCYLCGQRRVGEELRHGLVDADAVVCLSCQFAVHSHVTRSSS